MNKVESGVRYTHVPSGLTAASCAQRTQGKNEGIALRLLISKIKAQLDAERQKSGREVYANKPRASFGNQVRSYILHGQQRVIDHRTQQEGRPDAVLNGNLEPFLVSYMRSSLG